MATYNGERFIREQLESIARQTILPSELVVTDDCSTDRTIDVIKDFALRAPFPIYLHRNETRLGYADNFLKAASLCSGSLIAFADQDDVWSTNKLARCAGVFKHDSILLAVHSAEVVHEDMKPAGWLFPHVRRDVVLPPLHKVPAVGISGFSMVFRSFIPLLYSAPRPWSAQDMTEPMIHDQWVAFLARVFGRTAYISDALVRYRRHGNTSTSPTRPSMKGVLRATLKAGAESYSAMAILNYHWADYLERSANKLTEDQRDNCLSAVQHYRRIGDFYLARSGVYRHENNIISRIGFLCELLRQGGYRPDTVDGLGYKSLIKDFVFAVIGSNKFPLVML